MNLEAIDWLIMAVYFTFVLGIGFYLKRHTKTSADFFEAGKSIPAWVAGLAFLSANLGAQEVIGMAGFGAKYGIATAHFYWVGAIPAMIFVGVFMMPFYYGSRARSVPEYLRLRFDEKTRGFNAITFAAMTVFSSGVSMYAMAKLIGILHLLDGPIKLFGLDPSWTFLISITISALIVLGYIFLGGLASAIYNEVLQFFLIVAGFFPLVWLGLKNLGGWEGLKAALPNPAMAHAWKGMESSSTNPLGVDWMTMVVGLGFVLSFGYWCTDFLVIQRAMAADSMGSARRTPLIAAVPKMLFPFLVIMPGLIAVALPTPAPAAPAVVQEGVFYRPPGLGMVPAKVSDVTGEVMLDSAGKPQLDYDLVIPNLLLHYFPSGLLGLGLTALLASFMSGMAGNVTAFNTVVTYDIYQAYVKPNASDDHYLHVGRLATVFGILASMVAAYLANQFNAIMDLLQLVFAFVNAPLFATFLLGMFWKRATGHGAFAGLISGTFAAALHHGLTLPQVAVAGVKGAWITKALGMAPAHLYPSDLAQTFWTAIVAWTVCFAVTVLVSLATKAPDEDQLVGLVYSLTERPKDDSKSFWAKPEVLGLLILVAAVILNIIFR